VVLEHGKRVAIQTAQGRCLTYAQLWRRALELRMVFEQQGVGKGDTVALCLPRSPDLVAGWIAGWLCEAVVLPLDVSLPEARRIHILHESCPRFVLSEQGLVQDKPLRNEVPPTDLRAPAYLIYTSGSSGQPKGVLVSHAGLTAILHAQIEWFQIAPTSRCLWMHGTGFDASLSDIGTALLAGAALCFDEATPHDLALIERLCITHVDLPPALLPYLNEPASLQTIVIGGEVCAAEVIRRWAGKTRLINVYGPTEATICSSMIVCDPEWNRAWIGSPIAGVEYRVIGEDGCEADTGELCISGAAVALGYPWMPELSKQRFIDHGRTYRTGDLVKKHACGGYEFLGRMDRQFKLHGRLICPEEVECALLENELVKRAYVLPWSSGSRTRLAAWVESMADVQVLRESLAGKLPDWMIPTRWEIASTMPCLANGKPDIEAIHAALSHPHPLNDAASFSAEEEPVRALFAEILEYDDFGPGDDFFMNLGGDSLEVVRLMALAAQRNLSISADAIHRGRTVAGVTRLIRENSTEAMARVDLMRDTALDLRFTPAVPAPPRCILVTGASGFLGKALVGELPEKVICLSRQSGMLGDVRLPRFGWEESRWHQLAEEVDVVVHLAADVKLFAPYSDLKTSQVVGTRNVLHFCAEGRPKMLHYASSLSVFVDADPLESWCREDDLRQGITQIHGGYAQSKWVAEQLVIAARQRGLRAAIHRLGLLSLDTKTGIGPRNDWMTLALPELVNQAPDDSRAFDLTPVDYAARVMAWLIRTGAEGIFHIANPQPVTQTQLAGLAAGTSAKNAPGTLAGGRVHRSLDLFKCSRVRFAMTRTSQALAGSGIDFPAITSDYLRRCLQHSEK
jgi:amino acid adenylation domain-containing protein